MAEIALAHQAEPDDVVLHLIVRRHLRRREERWPSICSWTLTTSIGLVHAAAAALEMPASASWVPSEPVAAFGFGFDIFALPRHKVVKKKMTAVKSRCAWRVKRSNAERL